MFVAQKPIDEQVARLIVARVNIMGSFASREAFVQFVRTAIETAGYRAVSPKEDKAGNCVVCGEAGRCPGYHAFKWS